MTNLLNKIRTPNRNMSLPKALIHTVLFAVAGVFMGVVAKLLDIYTSNLGNIFSQMSVWIFLCTVITVLSSTLLRSAANVFSFCMGMLAAYYLTAEMTSSVYSMMFVYGWTVFALLTPALGFCAWYAKGKGMISKIMIASIIFVMLTVSVILFDKIRIADIVFAILTSIVLLKK